jgi:hypothetical protein
MPFSKTVNGNKKTKTTKNNNLKYGIIHFKHAKYVCNFNLYKENEEEEEEEEEEGGENYIINNICVSGCFSPIITKGE